jgi:hypothetical protein
MRNLGDQRSSRSDATGSHQVQVTPPQLFEPVTVGPSPDRCHCTACHTPVHEGEQIGVYAYRLASTDRWDVARVFCRVCTPEQLPEPTLGVAELLVTGTLGTLSEPATQSHRLCVTEVLTQHVSPPTEGVQP